jgi:hypothetical protein
MQPSDKPIPASFNLAPSGQLTEFSTKPVNHLIPGLVEAGSTVIFKVLRNVECGAYPARVATAIAGGISLAPFGKGQPHQVLLVHGQSNARADGLELLSILSSGEDLDARSLADHNLQVYHPQNEGGRALELRNPDVRARLMHLSDGIGCIVFADLDGCLTKTAGQQDFPIGEFFADLNRRGTAVIAFATAGTADRLAPELAMAVSYLSLHVDHAAPSGVGGGFTVTRKRTDIHDKVPRKFRYFYQIVGGVFEDHFSIEDVEEKTLKQLSILRRQSEVAVLLSQGMTQKDIAAQMETTTAMICRDAEAIQSQQAPRSRLAEIHPFQPGAGA